MDGIDVQKIRFRAYKDIILIVGKKEEGKSYFLKTLIRNIPRKIVWDYNHEHTEGIITHDLKDIPIAWKRNITTIIFQPYRRTDLDFTNFINVTSKYSNFTLCLEEVRRYATSHNIPSGLKDLIDTGRHRGIGLICTSRRSHGINVDIPFNADHIFAFKQHRPEDLKYLADYMNPEMVYKLPELPKYWFIHFDSKNTYIRRKV